MLFLLGKFPRSNLCRHWTTKAGDKVRPRAAGLLGKHAIEAGTDGRAEEPFFLRLRGGARAQIEPLRKIRGEEGCGSRFWIEVKSGEEVRRKHARVEAAP